MSKEAKDIVDKFMGISLNMLVESGFVDRKLIEKKWYTSYGMTDRLISDGFYAASTLDDDNVPVVFFNANSCIKGLALAIPHEAIHLAQICKKDLEPCDGYSIWKGKKYPQLDATDPNYSSPNHQPWEAEALGLEERVREALYNKFPKLRSL